MNRHTAGSRAINWQSGTDTKGTYRKPSEQLFAADVTKHMKTYIRCNKYKNQHQNKTVRTTTEVSPWNGQLYTLLGA